MLVGGSGGKEEGNLEGKPAKPKLEHKQSNYLQNLEHSPSKSNPFPTLNALPTPLPYPFQAPNPLPTPPTTEFGAHALHLPSEFGALTIQIHPFPHPKCP